MIGSTSSFVSCGGSHISHAVYLMDEIPLGAFICSDNIHMNHVMHTQIARNCISVLALGFCVAYGIWVTVA